MTSEHYRDGIDKFFFTVDKAKDVKGLFQVYQQMLHNLRYFSSFHLEKVRIFINDLYFPTLIWKKDYQEKFNSDPNNITRLKKLLSDLYDHSKSKSSSKYYMSGKDEQRTK